MGDGFEWDFVTKGFHAHKEKIDKATDKATLYALRSTGRLIGRVAKKESPVYPGPLNMAYGTDPRAQAESGNLKKSISNSRRITKIGKGDYSLKVGPFGRKKAGTAIVRHGSAGALSSRKSGTSSKGQIRGVQLYRSQANQLYGFMDSGVRAGDGPVARKIFEDAYQKAYEKARG